MLKIISKSREIYACASRQQKPRTIQAHKSSSCPLTTIIIISEEVQGNRREILLHLLLICSRIILSICLDRHNYKVQLEVRAFRNSPRCWLVAVMLVESRDSFQIITTTQTSITMQRKWCQRLEENTPLRTGPRSWTTTYQEAHKSFRIWHKIPVA